MRIVLVYPPIQFWPDTSYKPDGSLSLPVLGGALLGQGFDVTIFDACVGNDKDKLEDSFYNLEQLPSGLIKAGVCDARILEEVEHADVVGITSTFTFQESMARHTVSLIRQTYPEKQIVIGGINARNRPERFTSCGANAVYSTGVEDMPDYNQAPIPAWGLLPNEKYWEIARPHGASFDVGMKVKYASLMTSIGCVFHCSFCHINNEINSKFRVKSDARVIQEVDRLIAIGVEHIFIEDDTFFGDKQRAIRLLHELRLKPVAFYDVNGLNVIHLFKEREPDEEVICILSEAGFKEVAIAFESASQRILKKYASNKWDIESYDIPKLLQLCKKHGLSIEGNYVIGFPDETREEIANTINMAREHRNKGLAFASFMLATPLPGTSLFEYAMQNNYLPAEIDTDKLNWSRACMVNTTVDPKELERIRHDAWLELNDSHYTKYKER